MKATINWLTEISSFINVHLLDKQCQKIWFSTVGTKNDSSDTVEHAAECFDCFVTFATHTKYRVYQNNSSGFEVDYIHKYGEQNYK